MRGTVQDIRRVRSYWVVYVGFAGTTNKQHFQFTTKRAALAFCDDPSVSVPVAREP